MPPPMRVRPTVDPTTQLPYRTVCKCKCHRKKTPCLSDGPCCIQDLPYEQWPMRAVPAMEPGELGVVVKPKLSRNKGCAHRRMSCVADRMLDSSCSYVILNLTCLDCEEEFTPVTPARGIIYVAVQRAD